MTDAAAPPAADSPAPGTPPAGTASSAPPVVASKPDFLPDTYWDAKAGGINTEEFGKHYGELTAAQKALADRQAAVPQNPDAYKPEIKLPADLKVPDGMNLKIDDKDPRLAQLRAVAHQRGWTQDDFNAAVTLDAQLKIEAHNAEVERVAAENKKLGANADTRKAAAANWAKGLRERNDISPEEYDELLLTATSAAGVTLIEKLMAKSSGSVPGHQPERPSTPPPKTAAEGIWPNGFSQVPQARAS